MKQTKLMLSIALLSFAGLSTTLTSCGTDDVVCATGFEGKDCDIEVREGYYNTYRGNASDNQGGSYTDWALRFSSGGTDATKLKLEVLDNTDANKFLFEAVLNSNTTFGITPKSMVIDGTKYNYTGQGSINENTASFTLTEEDDAGIETTYIYTFSNFNK